MSNKLPETWKELQEWAKQYGWKENEDGIEKWDSAYIGCFHGFYPSGAIDVDSGWIYQELKPKQIAIIIQVLENKDDKL